MAEAQEIRLTHSQAQQLAEFLEEQDGEHGVLLRPAQALGYVEAVLLDEDDQPITPARVLFPS